MRGRAEGEGKADSALSWEPTMGLDLTTLRSQVELRSEPEPKIRSWVLNQLSHPGTLEMIVLSNESQFGIM